MNESKDEEFLARLVLESRKKVSPVIRLNDHLHQVLQSASVLRNTELVNGHPTQITPQCVLEVNLQLHDRIPGRE